MSIDGIDTIEIYEAFAPVVLAAHRMREAAAGIPHWARCSFALA